SCFRPSASRNNAVARSKSSTVSTSRNSLIGILGCSYHRRLKKRRPPVGRNDGDRSNHLCGGPPVAASIAVGVGECFHASALMPLVAALAPPARGAATRRRWDC